MLNPAIRALASQVCGELGAEWTVVFDGAHLRLSHADGRRLGVSGIPNGWDSNGRDRDPERVSIWACYPDTDRCFRKDERIEATAAIDKGAVKIARQIQSERVMGRYMQTLDAVRAYNQEKDSARAALEEKGQKLGQLFAHGATVKATPYTCEIFSHRGGREFTAKIYSGKTSMELRNMPHAVALAVTTAYEHAMAAHHGEPLTEPKPAPAPSATPMGFPDATSDPSTLDTWGDDGGAQPNVTPPAPAAAVPSALKTQGGPAPSPRLTGPRRVPRQSPQARQRSIRTRVAAKPKRIFTPEPDHQEQAEVTAADSPAGDPSTGQQLSATAPARPAEPPATRPKGSKKKAPRIPGSTWPFRHQGASLATYQAPDGTYSVEQYPDRGPAVLVTSGHTSIHEARDAARAEVERHPELNSGGVAATAALAETLDVF
ncbi:hypothetical protein [Streptomyces palmae]|uniref:Uncharacterized protein n=1 Tax=Streptomyces palmae TaxID=1701085 RepID=A0A4Z0GVN2_9ACTN|nr:hypothetical protein [Streptomyces palmae]TGB01815.1 hypothetical protein E4099_20805 [Streptomyces palmae]